jgi:hypothetical protein
MRIPRTPIREEITRIVETSERIKIGKDVFSIVPSVVKNITGVTLLERRDYLSDCRKCINCVNYCFENNPPKWIPSLNPLEVIPVPSGYFEVENPLEKDLAIYFDGTTEEKIFVGEFQHIGRVSKKGLVISKWGCGDVYLHSPELVPSYYGEMLKFFRKE